jgi:hypothetical protein
MREIIRDVVENARRSEERIGVDGQRSPRARLAAEAIRLARVATSIHLTDSTRLLAAGWSRPDRALITREHTR